VSNLNFLEHWKKFNFSFRIFVVVFLGTAVHGGRNSVSLVPFPHPPTTPLSPIHCLSHLNHKNRANFIWGRSLVVMFEQGIMPAQWTDVTYVCVCVCVCVNKGTCIYAWIYFFIIHKFFPFGATWRRLRYKTHPSATLRNFTLKEEFKRSLYQQFQFTGEYSLTKWKTLVLKRGATSKAGPGAVAPLATLLRRLWVHAPITDHLYYWCLLWGPEFSVCVTVLCQNVSLSLTKWRIQCFRSIISKEMMQWHNFNIQVRLLYKWDNILINLCLTSDVDVLIS
jgi:hypothetical protein